MKVLKYFLLFLFINFGSLALGTLLMNDGPMTDWYMTLHKAPWTPPGWVFGFAWTTIMLCFSIYLAYLFTRNNAIQVKTAFAIQVLLNISWNYIFFNQHLLLLGLVILVLLNVVLYYFFFSLKKNVELIRYLLLPYIIWLSIATSLNLYILIYN